jgi:hypothetical protein
MHRYRTAVLVLVLIAAFAAGLMIAPQVYAGPYHPYCWLDVCRGNIIECCEGQVCCPPLEPPPDCFGDPPICR